MAYADRSIPLGEGRALPAPAVLGLLLTALATLRGERALVVGAGSGYSAAVLAEMGLDVTSVESSPALVEIARKNGVKAVEGPLAEGSVKGAPYDIILVDGAIDHIPDALIDQLGDGGRLGGAIIERGITRLFIGRRAGGGFGFQPITDASTPVLPGFERPKTFTFEILEFPERDSQHRHRNDCRGPARRHGIGRHAARGARVDLPDQPNHYRPARGAEGDRRNCCDRPGRQPSQVSATAGVNQDLTRTGGGNGRNFSAGVDVSYPLFNGGSVSSQIKAAKTRVEAGRATLRAVEGDVFTEAVSAYMDVIRDRAIVELNKNKVDVLGTNLQATRDRFEIGDLTRTDVAQSEARLELARSNLATAGSRLAGSEENYRRVIGHSPDVWPRRRRFRRSRPHRRRRSASPLPATRT